MVPLLVPTLPYSSVADTDHGVRAGGGIGMARGSTGAGAAVSEAPGVGEAGGLNGRADIRRIGREADRRTGRRRGIGESNRGRHVIDGDHDRTAAGQLMGVGHGERRRIAARIGIRVRGVQRARLIRPVAKVPGVGERSGAASLGCLAECEGRLGVDRQGGTRIDARRTEDRDCLGAGADLAVLVRRRHGHGVRAGGGIGMARGSAGAGAAVTKVPGVGEARGLNGGADIRRGGREAQGGPGSSRAGPGQARRRRHVIDRDHDRAAAGQVVGVGHGERRRVAARIGIRVRRVQRARLIRAVAKVPGVG